MTISTTWRSDAASHIYIDKTEASVLVLLRAQLRVEFCAQSVGKDLADTHTHL